MSVHLSPIGNAFQFFNTNGRPLSLGSLYAYAAGTTTPQTTYSDSGGSVPNADPIVLDSSGRVQTEIWLTDGQAYKFVLKDLGGSILGTYDNITGIGDPNLANLLAASGGSALVGYLQSGTGAVARTVQSRLRDSVSVKDFGAAGNGSTDDTTAIQNAINTGSAVYFPPGTYKISSALSFSTLSQIFHGAGKELSIISISGASNGFVSSGSLVRCHFRDLQILGGGSSLNGIDLSSGNVYESCFEHLIMSVGGKCIYAPQEFSSQFINVHLSSANDNGMEVAGGSATVFIGCYVHTISTSGKYGIRSWAGGTFIGLNSLDSGEAPVLCGRAVAKGDATDVQYRAVFVGCNFEDFTKQGARFRYNGTAFFQQCTFFPPATGTYDCSIYIEFCDQLVQLNNTGTTSKGATRNKLAEVFSEGGNAPLSFNSFSTWDDNTTLTTVPNVNTTLSEFAVWGFHINKLNVDRMYGFYSPSIPTWTANASTFSVAAIDRVKTANTGATNLTNATGGVDGQTLIVHVRDGNTTIKNLAGGTGEFRNKTGADIIATSGLPYMYIGDGGAWAQI